MDYADPQEYFAGTVEVTPVTPRQIPEMRKAYQAYSRNFEYPAGWSALLDAAEKWFVDNKVGSLTVNVSVVPSQTLVNTPGVRP